MTGLGKSVVSMMMVGALAIVSAADEVKVPLDKVPGKVIDAIKAKFPSAELTGAEKDVEDGKTTYEVALTYKESKYEVGVTEEGKIIEVEKTIPVADLPKAVTAAVNKKYPEGKLKSAEEITADEKINYEVVVVNGDKTLEMLIDPKGKVLKDESDEKDKD